MMKRRAFLGFLGGAAVAGPAVAKSAAEMSLADISLRKAGIAVSLGPNAEQANGTYDHKGWAKDRLSQLIGKTPVQIAREKASQYVDGLDPEIACLRSVALHSKVRMTREANYERNQKRELTYLEGVLVGWWD